MFLRMPSRLVASITLAIISLVVMAVLLIPSFSVQADTSLALTERGGALIPTNGQVTVTVSAGAVKQPVTVISSANVSPTFPTRLIVIGSAFTLASQDQTAVGLMQIAIHYTVPAGINEKDLVVVYYDVAADKWLPLPTQVDTGNHIATASANQAGQFALVRLASAASLSGNAVIVDDLDTSHFARYGSSAGWNPISGTTDRYYLGHMYWTLNTYNSADNYAV